MLNKLSLSTLTIQLIRPLSGSSYIKLPTELRSPKKGLINMILTDLCFTQQKKKNYFWKHSLQCFSSRKILTQHKDICLSINGAQSVRFEKGNK